MHKHVIRVCIGLTLAVTLVLISAMGKEALARSADEDKGWHFSVAPYLWLPALDGDITVRGRTAPVDLSIGDFTELVFENFRLAAIGHVEARRDRWILLTDVLYLSLKADEDTPLMTQTEIDYTQLILEFGGGYRLGTWPVGEEGPTTLTADVLAGGRYVYMDTELEIRGSGPLGASVKVAKDVDWLDPFVGLRLWFAFTDTFTVTLRGDVGGFDVGSDFTWNAVGTFQFHLSEKFTLVAGYRALDIEYDQGRDRTRFVYDVQLRGPVLGVNIHF
ncbi:MAG: hypothetical protein OEU26_24375 [Candidatus Tectomicrobia bacterium]|nr:hypothetical protein [Candidatus Tectomicrobia bacterium]